MQVSPGADSEAESRQAQGEPPTPAPHTYTPSSEPLGATAAHGLGQPLPDDSSGAALRMCQPCCLLTWLPFW